MYLRNIPLIKLFTAFSGMAFVFPVMVIYYGNKGLSMSEFMLIQGIFAVVLFLFEVPSGYLSDVWRRSHVLFLGIFIKLIGYIIILFSHGFWPIATGEVFVAIGVSLVSGTTSAILYDSLLYEKKTKSYKAHEGALQASLFYGATFSALIGGWLFSLHGDLPMMFSITFCFIAMVLAFLLKNPPQAIGSPEKMLFANFTLTIKHTFKHLEINRILLYSAIFFGGTLSANWFRQVYMEELLFPYAWFGAVIAACFFLRALSCHAAHTIEQKFGVHKTFIGIAVIQVLMFAYFAVYINLFGVILFILLSLPFGIAGPTITAAINTRIPSNRRATVLSIEAMARRVGYLFIGPAAGVVMDIWSLQAAMFMITLVTAVAFIFAFVGFKYKNIL